MPQGLGATATTPGGKSAVARLASFLPRSSVDAIVADLESAARAAAEQGARKTVIVGGLLIILVAYIVSR